MVITAPYWGLYKLSPCQPPAQNSLTRHHRNLHLVIYESLKRSCHPQCRHTLTYLPSSIQLLLLSRFSHVQLCATPWTAAHQAPLSLGFSRQEDWSGLPFPSPMRESKKWKWSRSVVSDPQRPHGLQPTRLLCPWDFPGKSTGVGCHCLLRSIQYTYPIKESQNIGEDRHPSRNLSWLKAYTYQGKKQHTEKY